MAVGNCLPFLCVCSLTCRTGTMFPTWEGRVCPFSVTSPGSLLSRLPSFLTLVTAVVSQPDFGFLTCSISLVLHSAARASFWKTQVHESLISLDRPVPSKVLQSQFLILAYKHSHVWPPLPLCLSSAFPPPSSGLSHLPPSWSTLSTLRAFAPAVSSSWKKFPWDIHTAFSLLIQLSPPPRVHPWPLCLI